MFFEKLTMENFQFLKKIVDLPLQGRLTILTYRDLIDIHVNDWRDTTHFDSKDDNRTGCQKVSHC